MRALRHQAFPAPYCLAITAWNYIEHTISPQKTQVFQGEVMKARGVRRWFNLGPCDITRFLRDKHNRSSRQLGLLKLLILIVYHVSYEAHNYDSVGREICTKTVVALISLILSLWEGWELLEWLQLVRVETSEKSKQYSAIIPLWYFRLCNRYTFTVLA